MVTRSTADETILQSDRVPVYVGVNSLYLKKGLQSTNRTIDIPNEVIKEQGNQLNRGISTQAPQITVSFEDLSVDLDMEQVLTQSWATIGTQVSSGVFLTGNLTAHAVGPTDEITGLVISYLSGGYTRIGEGARVTTATSTMLTLASAAGATNFAVGDTIIVQQNSGTVNITGVSGTITAISGVYLSYTGFNASGLTGLGQKYVYVKDNYAILSSDFKAGIPAKSVKGIEIFCANNGVTGNVARTYLAYFPITAAGTVTDIDSNDMRNSEVDILMLYNDYSDNLIFSRYIQDAAVTSVGFNYTADGNATQTYDFQTGKSLDYAGYVNRRATIASASATVFVVSNLDGVFVGSEVVDPIMANTTLNEAGDRGKNFLKVTTLTTAGVKKTWTEVASGATTIATDEYKYVNATSVITFGETVTTGTRIEFTYLCDAAYVADANAYKFDATAFDHTGTPDVVTGRYQPLTINNSDFDNRVDGVESTSFTLGFTRDYFMAQGILSQRVKPAQIGTVDGSFSTREGFSKVMTLITEGNYTALANKQQMDAGKAATFTAANDIPLRVRLYDPADNITEVKTVESDAIQITNINNSNSVGDDSTFEVSFTGVTGSLKFSR